MEAQYSQDEQKVIDLLSKINQQHLYENLTKFSAEDRQKFVDQVNTAKSILISFAFLLFVFSTRSLKYI